MWVRSISAAAQSDKLRRAARTPWLRNRPVTFLMSASCDLSNEFRQTDRQTARQTTATQQQQQNRPPSLLVAHRLSRCRNFRGRRSDSHSVARQALIANSHRESGDTRRSRLESLRARSLSCRARGFAHRRPSWQSAPADEQILRLGRDWSRRQVSLSTSAPRSFHDGCEPTENFPAWRALPPARTCGVARIDAKEWMSSNQPFRCLA